MRRGSAGAVPLLVVALLLLVPTVASARRFRGHETFRNYSHKIVVSAARARRLTKRTLHRNFAIRRHSSIYACSRHSATVSGCDFAFTGANSGAYYCGNTTVRASRRYVVVRFIAYNSGCGDF